VALALQNCPGSQEKLQGFFVEVNIPITFIPELYPNTQIATKLQLPGTSHFQYDLILDRWRYAFYRKSRQADAEGEAWESAKKSCGGLHFLAVQESLDSELCTGFWLLIDVQRSPV
jgi:hypothetical protein